MVSNFPAKQEQALGKLVKALPEAHPKLIVLQALAGPNALILLCTAYVTDLISPRNRAPALALNMAAFGIAFALGPGIGGVVGTVLASWLTMGGVLFTLILLLLFISESLGPDARAKVLLSAFFILPASLSFEALQQAGFLILISI